MFGKLLGFTLGLYLTRTITGAIIGAVVGHLIFDRPTRKRRHSQGFNNFNRGFMFGSHSMFQRQDIFFQLFFMLLGKLAKSDGTISQKEELFLSKLIDTMNLYGEQKNQALAFFKNAADDTSNSYQDIAREFHNATMSQPQLRRQLMYQLVALASVDNVITSEESNFLEDTAQIFQISQQELEHMLSSFGASNNKSYHILGVSPTASDTEVKKAYKALIKEYHPDILKSKGLPPSMLDFAQKRFQDIQNAWDIVKKERNI